MTIYMNNIKGTLSEMDDLFCFPSLVSVRHYAPAKKDNNNFDIIIRCDEDVAKLIKRKRSIKSINKIVL